MPLGKPLIRTSFCLVLAALLNGIALAAWASPVFVSADFTGGLNSVTSSMKTRLGEVGFDAALFNCATCADPTSVSGHVIYDSSIPVPSVGTVNVFSIAPISAIPDRLIFEIDIDGISAGLGDTGILGGPAIQYKDGNFNGFFFAENFSSPNGTTLKLNLQGPSFDLRRVSDNAVLFSGRINALTNPQPFDPATFLQATAPEPGSVALFGIALAGLAFRRRNAVRSQLAS